MAKRPGVFDKFNGLWVRGHVDNVPSDHFADCQNVSYSSAGVSSGDSTTEYLNIPNIVRTALYKPTPPFSGTNVPRIIALKTNGELWDLLLNSIIYTNVLMKDFGFVNFFGRCYFSPSDGKVGLSGVNVQVYNGSGVSRDAGGSSPTTPLTAVFGAAGNVDVGTYLLSYAFETASGFITPPAAPFVGVDSLGGGTISITSLPLGPAGTVARWVIITKSFPLASIGPLGGPWEVSRAEFTPLFFAARIGDNTTTTYSLNFFDEQLIESANYLFTRLSTIPAGVGLLDYKGRMISYGEFSNPSIVRVSEIGEPESLSSTSGFFITDPSDSTGVRCATEFRNILYVFKRHRGYVTQDNQLDASTWEVINFEKSLGTEQYGIAAVLDAKGSQSLGFLISSPGALYFFNGTVVEPELSYKIRDLWLRINKTYFHKIQAALDPDNKKIYILVPLDSSTTVSHIIEGDYRNGLDAINIKWSLTKYVNQPRSILIYEDFTVDSPAILTRLARTTKIVTINVNISGLDDGEVLPSFFDLPPVRFSQGVSQFTHVRMRVTGPCNLRLVAYSEDKKFAVVPPEIVAPAVPGREYAVKFNLINEQCRLKVSCTGEDFYKINYVIIDGKEIWKERVG